MERVGMAPQFALGQVTPRHISTGDLTVYGAIDLMLERYDLFTQMSEGKPLGFIAQLE